MKLFASDIDNTLVPQGKVPDKNDIQRLEQYLNNITGVKIAYISGRNFSMTQEVLSKFHLPRPDFIASDVGTLIHYLQDGKWKKDKKFEKYLASSGFNREAIKAELEDMEGVSLQEEEVQSEFKLSYYTDLGKKEKSTLFAIEEILEEIPGKLIYSEDQRRRVGLIDIVPRVGGKVGAIKFLSREVGADMKEVVYAGDSGNDIDIFNAGFKGILVGNASPKIKKAFRNEQSRVYVANDKFCQGVIEGLEHFLEKGVEEK